PCRIEFERWHREAVWHLEQMIEEAECFVVCSDGRIDFCKTSCGLRSTKGVLRFRQQFYCVLAFVNCVFFLTQPRQNGAELHMTTRILGSLTHKLLCNWSGSLESGLRFHLLALMQIKSAFHQSFWATACLWVKQCFSAKLLHHLKGISEPPL